MLDLYVMKLLNINIIEQRNQPAHEDPFSYTNICETDHYTLGQIQVDFQNLSL